MPAGHPDISQMSQPPAAGAMPSGDMPAGHPPMPQTGMPPGHPPIQAGATTQPASTATLSVKAMQMTAGGPVIGALPAVVELHQGEGAKSTAEITLKDDGTFAISNLPLERPFQPVVRLSYQNVEYQAIGQVMSPANPSQQIVVPVYETTEQTPAWQVKMRHVMVSQGTEGIDVLEVFSVENPGDRAWVGTSDSEGKKTTFTWQLPAGAEHVKLLGGFHDCCTTIQENQIINAMALTPGSTQYQVAYTVHAKDGSAVLQITAPAPTAQVIAAVPDDGSVVTAQGLELTKVMEMKNGPTRIYKAANVAANQPVQLSLSGLKPPAPPPAPAASATSAGSSRAAQVIAGVGGLMIVLVGGALLFARGGKSAKKA
jgi:hypothetical protein